MILRRPRLKLPRSGGRRAIAIAFVGLQDGFCYKLLSMTGRRTTQETRTRLRWGELLVEETTKMKKRSRLDESTSDASRQAVTGSSQNVRLDAR